MKSEIGDQFEGFLDVTGLVRAGVYLLVAAGRVVYVGRSRNGQMLALIAAHRELAKKLTQPWFPIRGITFDQVLIQTVHPDRLDEVYASLIAKYNPRHNLPAPSVAPSPLARRL